MQTMGGIIGKDHILSVKRFVIPTIDSRNKGIRDGVSLAGQVVH